MELLVKKSSAPTILLAISLTAFALPARAASSAFAGLEGAWSGSGSISLSDGSKERLRCKANYLTREGGVRLQQTLRCASDSYRFELSSDLTSQGGALAGSWSESNRGMSGSLVGRASGGTISAVADAPGFSANLTVSTRGDRQSFSLTSQSEIRGVHLQMSRQ
jgi:hypothetical protein